LKISLIKTLTKKKGYKNRAAVMRNITYEINWKIGVVSGKITPARRV